MTNLNEGLITPCIVSIKKTRHLSDDPPPHTRCQPRPPPSRRAGAIFFGLHVLFISACLTDLCARLQVYGQMMTVGFVESKMQTTENTTKHHCCFVRQR